MKLMKRIIKHGKFWKNPRKRVTCQNCGCIFEYINGDVSYSNEDVCFVKCPECLEKITVNNNTKE